MQNALSHYTTDDVAPSDTFAYWREVICAVYVQLHAEPLFDEKPFNATVHAWDWTSVTISRVQAGSQIVTHPESDPRDDCLLSMQLSGRGVISQAGRNAVLSPGDFAIYDATRPYSLSFDNPFTQIVLQFPRQLLIDRKIDLEQAVAQRSIRGTGLTDVVSSMATTLESNREELPVEVQMRMGMQLVDCIASALSVDGYGEAPLPIERSAQQRVVLDHVAARLGDFDLSVASVANALGRSSRSLQQLFSGGVGLSARIRTMRLQRAADALVNPLLAHQSISRIGADNGFGDPATFSRAFKREFGYSPSDLRFGSAPTQRTFG